MNKKRSIGTMIFLILDALLLFNVIRIATLKDKFVNIYLDLGKELSTFKYVILSYGYIISIILAMGVMVTIAREWMKSKSITLKTSIIAFVIMALWLTVFMINAFAPILELQFLEL